MKLNAYRHQTRRKSLRQALKDLLERRRPQGQTRSKTVGSGILRKADQPNMYLAGVSRILLFPDFDDSSRFHIDIYNPHIPNRFEDNDDDPFCKSGSWRTLLPKTSLSQFNLNHGTVAEIQPTHSRLLQKNPEILVQRTGTSLHASLVSVSSVHTHFERGSSILRIRKSAQSMPRDRWAQSGAPYSSTDVTSEGPSVTKTDRTSGTTSSSRSKISSNTPELRSSQTLRKPLSKKRNGKVHRFQSGAARKPPCNASIVSVEHFGSFCVLDTGAPGCPVTATSENLRYIFDIGEPFFLNNQKCSESMDIVTGSDAVGDEITHLVLFSPLVSPSSGRSRFMLAALIDVTNFIKDAAATPELDTISEGSVVEEEVSTPVLQQTTPLDWRQGSYELSSEDLLGGCYINEGPSIEKMPIFDAEECLDDVWLDLAREEKCTQTSKSGTSTPKSSPSLSQPSNSTAASFVDDVLGNFMSDLQQLYSDFFVLAKSPLQDDYYEICNVSPSQFARKDYVDGHLSQNPSSITARLSDELAGERPFDMKVRWGIIGEERRLYCIPLFGQRSLTWICMLVDSEMPALWW